MSTNSRIYLRKENQEKNTETDMEKSEGWKEKIMHSKDWRYNEKLQCNSRKWTANEKPEWATEIWCSAGESLGTERSFRFSYGNEEIHFKHIQTVNLQWKQK